MQKGISCCHQGQPVLLCSAEEQGRENTASVTNLTLGDFLTDPAETSSKGRSLSGLLPVLLKITG